ncbi:MAG: TetR/AcrR family transcriptional regulator [Phycisphaerae bacterium]
MPRPAATHQKRAVLTPVVARAFVELGYRRATTAQLAQRCGVRENILYRIWPDKRAMFVAAIEYVFEFSSQTWRRVLADTHGASPAERLLAFEAQHHGEFGLYRILFAGLSEIDDPEIGAALRRTYARFGRFLAEQIAAHRHASSSGAAEPPETPAAHDAGPARRRRRAAALPADAERVAWAFIGLGTAANLGRELNLLTRAGRQRLLREVGARLLREA